jgi:hypothetical protein
VETITRTRRTSTDRFVVGWAADLVQVWPEEDRTIGAPAPAAHPDARPDGGRFRPLGTPRAVLELLAALDGRDQAVYARHYASQAGSVLALTHRSEDEVLAASLEIHGSASPAAVLAVLHRDSSIGEHRLAG